MRNVSMTDEELDTFLNNHDELHLATVSENGWPHVVPVAYATFDEGDDRLYILTHPEQRKSQNIFQDNRVGLVIDDGEAYTELRGAFMHGYATLVRDKELIAKIEDTWVDQCYDGELPEVVQKVYGMRSGWVWFAIEPAHTVTWDNTKLDADRLRDHPVPEEGPFTYSFPEDAGAAEPRE